MTTRILFATVVLSVAAWISSANADSVTFNFTGTVNTVAAPLAGTFNTTQSLSGSFTFDSNSADLQIDPNIGLYRVVVPNSLSFSIGSYSGGQVGPSNSDLNVIYIQNDNPDQYTGDWVNSISGPAVGSYNPIEFFIDLTEPSNAVFSNDALPLLPPSLAAFSNRRWGLLFTNEIDVMRVEGTLTSLTVATPEPTTFLLGGTGLVGFALAYWRGRRRASH